MCVSFISDIIQNGLQQVVCSLLMNICECYYYSCHKIFTQSSKHNKYRKWKENLSNFLLIFLIAWEVFFSGDISLSFSFFVMKGNLKKLNIWKGIKKKWKWILNKWKRMIKWDCISWKMLWTPKCFD